MHIHLLSNGNTRQHFSLSIHTAHTRCCSNTKFTVDRFRDCNNSFSPCDTLRKHMYFPLQLICKPVRLPTNSRPHRSRFCREEQFRLWFLN